MSYNKKVWKSGDRITKEALNNMENGIEAAHQNSGGTGSVAIVDNLNSNSSTSALSAKQGKELNNKMPAKSIVEGGKIYLAKEDGTKLDSGTELPAGGSTIEVVNNLESDSTTAALSAAQGKALNTQYKDIANLFTAEQTTNFYKIKCGNKVIAEIPLGSSVPTIIKYTITNTLSNATNSNSVTEIEENQSYTATITPNKGYSINSAIITMGGTNITDSVYNDGNINIPNVTGDLVITVECTEVVTSIDNEKLLDMDLTGLSDGSVTSFTNTVSNDIATVSDNKLTNIKNSKVTVDKLYIAHYIN